MAQCEAEGRKHPTMDLYAGIFNSKLYTSSRGSTRLDSVDKWSRNGFKSPSAAHTESFREDSTPASKSSFQSRSLRDRPPVLSDLGSKVTSFSNGGSARFGKQNSVVEVGYDGIERNSSQRAVLDVDHANHDKEGFFSDVRKTGDEVKRAQNNVGLEGRRKSSTQTEVGYVSPAADVGVGMLKKSFLLADNGCASLAHAEVDSMSNQKKNLYPQTVNGNCNMEGSSPATGRYVEVRMESLSANAIYGSAGALSSQSRMGHGNMVEKISQVDLGLRGKQKNHSPVEAANQSQIGVKNAQEGLGNGFDDNLALEYDINHFSDRKTAYRHVGYNMYGNGNTEDRPALTPRNSTQGAVEVSSHSSIFRITNAGAVARTLDVPSDSDRVNEGNLIAMKRRGFSAIDGPSSSQGAGLSKTDKTPGDVSARRSFAPDSNFARIDSKLDALALTSGAPTTPNLIADDEDLIHHSVPDLCNSARFQRSGELNAGARSETSQVYVRGSSTEIHMDMSNMRSMSSEKSGEMLMGFPIASGYVKAGNVGEIDTGNQGNASGLVLKNSPSRGHNCVANLRLGGAGSNDSSSSHGGSSHSGSPTAAESIRDSRVSSFGNILISKGSPHSVSSRSMGSSSISGNGTLAASKSTFNDILAPQFRYSTTAGRKSAEIVPNRRSSEIVPSRKSSEMTPNGYLRGAASQGFFGDGGFASGNVSRGSGNLSIGSNASLNNGNLLVGSTNGNVLSVGGGMKSSNKQAEVVSQIHAVDCTLLKKALASSDPEEMKNAGNEYYRRGHFAEALILYNRAITLSPSNAAYRSNRAAALSGLGRLGEAVKECEDAIRLDSGYSRAHQRVAALYLRLGLTEWARQHFSAPGQQTDLMEMQRLRNVDGHLSRCMEARARGDWQTMIRECDAAVVAGADSAPQIFGYKSEALLGLHKPEEADGVCTAAQRVERSLVKAGVIPADPFMLTVRAQIDMALGRFEGAVEAAKSASKIGPQSEKVAALLSKAQAVCNARAMGNDLFKAGRFFEALASYAEGLESDPTNAVLLCNRAACRSKIGQWEKAVEDCNAALRVQPNYTKALMRRANCSAKLERWEDALQDYELLRRKMPEDLEVARGIFDVYVAMKKSQGEDTRKMKFGGDVQEVLSDEEFHEAISSPGLSVVQFVTRWSERCRQLSPFVDDLCKRNPCVNFVKVDVEDVPYLAKIEAVSFIPTFKIYKNGQKVKEILGPTEQSLEYALKHYAL